MTDEISFMVQNETGQILVILPSTALIKEHPVELIVHKKGGVSVVQGGKTFAAAEIQDQAMMEALRNRSAQDNDSYDDFMIVESSEDGVDFFEKATILSEA